MPAADEVARLIERRQFDPLRVLFIGRDWWRKGGDIVLAACAIAMEGGLRLQLDVVGVEPPPDPLPSFATSHGNLSKRDPAQRGRLEGLLRQAHLLFMPSRAENYGIAFSEAAAYGVPSLTCAVGGIPTVVRAGVSGMVLPAGSPPGAFARAIHDCIADRARYNTLAWSARCFHDRRLSWDVFGERLIGILGHVSRRPAELNAAQ